LNLARFVPEPSRQQTSPPLQSTAFPDVRSNLPHDHRPSVGRGDNPDDLPLRLAVARPDVAEPPAKLQPMKGKAADRRPTIAAFAVVIRQQNGEYAFQPGVIRHPGVGE